jgi:hypothetical protein
MLGGLIVGSLTMLAISSCSQDHYRYVRDDTLIDHDLCVTCVTDANFHVRR